MDNWQDFSLCEYLGLDLEILVWILAGIIVLMLLILLIHRISIGRLKKRYKKFMGEADAKSLEETLTVKLAELESQLKMSADNQEKIQRLEKQMNVTFQKIGLIKYDAFDEMGGKLSFSLALLNEKNDGFIINAMHSREGCYTYIKEIIAGKSIIMLTKEEQEALQMALDYA